MTHGVNEKLNRFINRTAELITSTDVDIYNKETIMKLLAFNGYHVKPILKADPYHRPDGDSIILKISELGMPTQALKIHPDIFERARTMYRDTDSLEELASCGLATRVNWTAAIANRYYDEKIRVVFYDFVYGITLDKLPSEKGDNFREEWIDEVRAHLFKNFSFKDDLILTLSNFRIHPVLTDYNKIAKFEYA